MPARVVIDRYAYHERKAIMEEAGVDPIQATQAATMEGYNTGFALAATALANGDQEPAKELCRREMRIHGRQWALELWQAIKEAVAESLQ